MRPRTFRTLFSRFSDEALILKVRHASVLFPRSFEWNLGGMIRLALRTKARQRHANLRSALCLAFWRKPFKAGVHT
jgi:hypothetical protein